MVAANESHSGEVDDSPKIGGQVLTPPSTTTTTMPPPPADEKKISAPSLKPRALTLQTVDLKNNPQRVVDGELISPVSPHKANPRGVLKPHRQGPGRANTEPLPLAPDSNNVATPLTSLPSALSESPPLCVGSVLPNTKIAHPKPIGIPISACASPSSTTNTPLGDQSIRSGAPVGNVAQLEATAERLSTGTSSIGDAIRELHGELKRSDSRRSSSRAASVRATGDDPFANVPPVPPLSRHLSSASSILSTNIAARQGGYSPAGFVMSPSGSMTGRLRSGSKNSAGRPEIDFEPPPLSRHGPGKASVRSVRSAKMSLAEISESEPISLTEAAMDAADAAPPIDTDSPEEKAYDLPASTEQDLDHAIESAQSTEPSKQTSDPPTAQAENKAKNKDSPNERPSSSHSYSTFQQVENAFDDFDGVHCEEEEDVHHDSHHHPDEASIAEETGQELAEEEAGAHGSPEVASRPRRTDRARPQSYIDPGSGQQMLFYPARVPAMLNLPPKLSNKPKAADRDNRRSQVLSAMMDPQLDFDMHDQDQAAQEPTRESWLPDPLAGNRQSFIALSTDAGLIDPKENGIEDRPEEPPQPEAETQHLRRPQRLARPKGDNRKSRLDKLPPQLRASAFFDLPSASPAMETKDGSAMDTLDSMLDASMNAPVNAFTNHSFAGHLGPETYGKEKKQRPKSSANSSLRPPSLRKEPKKKASFLWFKRRHSDAKTEGDASALGRVNAETDDLESRPLASRDGDNSSHYHDEDDPERDPNDEERSESEEDDEPTGPPTTLLAELQIRKQQQKQRTAPISQMFQNGEMHATLLEMDAVAEVERTTRKNKRVNLAWEAPDAHHDQNGSDDEDVPLAIIAAKNQGAKNMADLERPIGLMERREIEDNEPLSQRRARLQGHDNVPLTLPKRQSVATLSAHLAGPFNRMQPPSPGLSATAQEPADEEIEGETLGDRKRRLGSKELPKARPVSSAFSTELLSQFGDLEEHTKPSTADDKSKENTEAPAEGGEETLGQRRRRLQAERKAREVEMSHNALVGPSSGPTVNRRLSLADMLSAHPKKENDPSREERQRLQKDAMVTREQDAKMAAMRQQMPTSLTGPTGDRAGGFRGGMYNDGRGGGPSQRLPAAKSTPTLMSQAFPNRSTVAISNFGMPQQTGYAGNNLYAGMNAGMNASMNNLNRMTVNPYAQSGMQQTLPLQSQLPMNGGSSMNRVEQWRHGVVP